jgi:hypothetical protein
MNDLRMPNARRSAGMTKRNRGPLTRENEHSAVHGRDSLNALAHAAAILVAAAMSKNGRF